MLLELKRRKSDNTCTIGDLYVNHNPIAFCQTLEDIVRAPGIKIPGQTAIPAGEYIILPDFSQRFQRIMPFLQHISMFTRVMIHWLNFASQTEGCIGVGQGGADHPDSIWHSKDTFNKLWPLLEAAFTKEVICISITDYEENI